MLKDGCKREGSLRKFAKTMGVSAPYLSNAIVGRQDPGPAICNYLKIRKVPINQSYYVRVK